MIIQTAVVVRMWLSKVKMMMIILWVVVSNVFYFHPKLWGKFPLWTQLVIITFFCFFLVLKAFTSSPELLVGTSLCSGAFSVLLFSETPDVHTLVSSSIAMLPLVHSPWCGKTKTGGWWWIAWCYDFLIGFPWKIRLFRSQHDHLDWAEYNAKVWDFQVWIHLPSKKPCWSQQWMQIW